VAAWLKFAGDFERNPLLLFQLRGMERAELFDTLRGRAEPIPEAEPEAEDAIEESIPVKLEPLPADPKPTGRSARFQLLAPNRASGACWTMTSSRNWALRSSLATGDPSRSSFFRSTIRPTSWPRWC